MKNNLIRYVFLLYVSFTSSIADTIPNQVVKSNIFTVSLKGQLTLLRHGCFTDYYTQGAGCQNLVPQSKIDCRPAWYEAGVAEGLHGKAAGNESEVYNCSVKYLSNRYPSGAEISVEQMSSKPMTVASYVSPYISWKIAGSRKTYRLTAKYCPDEPNGTCVVEPPKCEENKILNSENECVCEDTFEDVNGTCIKPKNPKTDEKDNDTCPNQTETYSHVNGSDRSFHEDIPVAGTNLKLWYDSARTSGYQHTIKVPFTGTTVNSNLKQVHLSMKVSDKEYVQDFLPPFLPEASYTFAWDGKNALGAEVEGRFDANITISYTYTQASGTDHVAHHNSTATFYHKSSKPELVDGWMLSAQSYLSDKIFLQTASANGDKKEYQEALFTTEDTLDDYKDMTQAKDGVYYIHANSIYKRWADDSIELMAERVGAEFVEVDSSGTLYVVSANAIVNVDANTSKDMTAYGPITATAMCNDTLYMLGSTQLLSWTKGGEPVEIMPIDGMKALTCDAKENLYISQGNKILKRDKEGTLSTIAGSDTAGYSGDYFLAKDASLNAPTALTHDKDENLYIYDSGNAKIRRIDKDGVITTVAGNGTALTGESINTTTGDIHGLSATNKDELYLLSVNGVHKIAHNPLSVRFNFNENIVKVDNSLAYIYDDEGYILRTLNPKGITLQTFAYDINKKLLSITDRFNQVITIERDASGLATAIIAPHGERTTLTRDARGFLEKISYDDNSAYTFEYLDNGLMITMIDPKLNRFSHTFDELGRVLEVSDQEGGNWTFGRLAGNDTTVLSTVVQALGSQSSYKKSETETTDDVLLISANGTQTQVSSHKDGKSKTVNSCGVTISSNYVLDQYNRQKRVKSTTTTLPSGLSKTTKIEKSYQSVDNLTLSQTTQSVTTNGKTTTIVDAAGQTTITSPENRTTTIVKDPTNLLVKQLQTPGLNSISYEHNGEGQVIQTTQGNRISSKTYDSKGNIATQTNANGEVTYYYYDAFNRVIQIKYPSTHSTYFTYDAVGNMQKLTTPTPADFMNSYNKINFKISDISPLGNETKYNYDAERRLTSIIRPSNESIAYTYTDALLSKMTRAEGVTKYSYGCGGKLTQVTAPNSESINYSYDGNLLTSMAYLGSLNQAITYAYNSDFAASSINYAGVTQAFNYDNDGLLTKSGSFAITRDITNGLATKVSDSIYSQDRSYNLYAEIDTKVEKLADEDIFSYEIKKRYPNGQIKKKVETHGSTQYEYQYNYDDMNRLIKAKIVHKVRKEEKEKKRKKGAHKEKKKLKFEKVGQRVEHYKYDPNGNRLRAIYSHDGKKTKYEYQEKFERKGKHSKANDEYKATYTIEDQIETIGSVTYTYDVDGYLTSKTDGSKATTYEYGSLGELKKVTLEDGRVIEYLHNANNQRVAKKVNGLITEKYLWKDLTTLLAVYNADDTLKYRFDYADARIPVSFTDTTGTYYLSYDQVGTLRTVTDSSGTVVKEISYDSFGNILSDSNSAMSLPFGFAGGLYDADTKLTRFGYRDYDSVTGKWTSKDPISFGGGDTNLLAYVGNDPVNKIDPTGLSFQFPIKHPMVCGLMTLNDGMTNADACSEYVGNLLRKPREYLKVCKGMSSPSACQTACSLSGFYEAFKEHCQPRLPKPKLKECK